MNTSDRESIEALKHEQRSDRSSSVGAQKRDSETSRPSCCQLHRGREWLRNMESTQATSMSGAGSTELGSDVRTVKLLPVGVAGRAG